MKTMTKKRTAPQRQAPKRSGRGLAALAGMGRNGDTEVGHLTPGEVVVPKRVMAADPGLQRHTASVMAQAGLDPARYVVGHPRNSRNPRTGAREFAAQMVSDPVNGTYWWDPATGQSSTSQPQDDAPQNNSANAMSAPQDNRNWGADQAVNQELARITGYTGNFGGGGFSNYMQGANDVQKQQAAEYLTSQGRGQRIDWNAGMVAPADDGAANNYGSPVASGDQSWGTNPDNAAVNQQLAQQLGYTGNFGGGAFNDWINGQSADLQQRAANILGAAGQPERIGNWGGNGFLNESPYINGTVPVGYVAPPAPPESGATQDLGQGYNTFDFGTGQDQIKNLYSYFQTYGQIPVASGFTPETNSSFGVYDPRPGFGGDWDPTFSQIASLTPEQFAALASSIGVDPNSRDAYLYINNYFGLDTLDYGPAVYQDGRYQGLANQNNPTVRESPLDRGYITVGAWPNVVDVPLEDIYSGKVNINALEMALSAGYDPNGMEGTMTSLQAADQIYRAMPDLKRIPINSAEFNTIRKPLEQAVPGFNAQVQNRINRQISQGRSIPSGNTVGPTDLGQVLGSVTMPTITTGGGTGGVPTGTPSAMSAAPPSAAVGQSILGGGGYVNNSPGWDRGWEDQGYYQVKDGVYQDDQGVLMIPQANGLFLDTMYGFYRNGQGTIVNADGTPVITQYNSGYPAGSSDPWRVFGSSGAMGMMGQFAGVDLRSLNDGNNTPIRGNYGGGTPTPIVQTFQGRDIVTDLRGDPWSKSIYNRGAGGTGGPAGGPGGGSPPSANTTSGTGGTGTGGTGTGGTGTGGTGTQTGTGLEPGTINPYSFLLSMLLGMGGGLNINVGGGSSTPLTPDTSNPYGLLNAGYYLTPGGYPVYTSTTNEDDEGGGIGPVSNNSQTVDFRSPFAYL